jgi:hypothetical protein
MNHRSFGVLAVAVSMAFGFGACNGNRSPAVATVAPRVLFETREEIPVGVEVVDALLADLDGNHVLDLALIASDDALRVLLGAGNGTFAPAGTYPAPGGPIRVVASDLDADGALDLLVLRHAAESVSVLINDGNGAFVTRPDLMACPDPVDLVAGDLTGDGLPDVTVAHRRTVDLLTFTGLGSGFFPGPVFVPLPADSDPTALELADVIGDRGLDLMVAEQQRGELIVFPGLVGGGQEPLQVFPAGLLPVDIAVGDLNLDGRPDVAVANRGSLDVTVLTANLRGFVPGSVQLSDPPNKLAVADLFGGDGVNDLVVTLLDRASVAVVPGTPSGGLGAEVRLDATARPDRALPGDVDRDGRTDLVVCPLAEDRLDLFRGRDGRLRGVFNQDTGIGTPELLAAANLDPDGPAEVAVAGSGIPLVAVLEMVPGVTSDLRAAAPALVAGIGRPAYGVSAGDLDGDGRIDLATCTDRGVKALRNVGVGEQVLLSSVPSDPDQVLAGGLGPFDLVPADMDGDGLMDLVYTDAAVPSVNVLRALSRSLVYEAFSFTAPVSDVPGSLAVGDFSGDGVPDVAVARGDGATVSVLVNDGRGHLSPLLDVPVLSGPSRLLAADVDGDRRADLVVSNGVSSDIMVLLAREGGLAPLTVSVGGGATALAVSDVNADGALDIVVGSTVRAEMHLVQGDGRGGFPVLVRLPGTLGASSAAAIDVNGDGASDLVIASPRTGRVSVYHAVPQ